MDSECGRGAAELGSQGAVEHSRTDSRTEQVAACNGVEFSDQKKKPQACTKRRSKRVYPEGVVGLCEKEWWGYVRSITSRLCDEICATDLWAARASADLLRHSLPSFTAATNKYQYIINNKYS